MTHPEQHDSRVFAQVGFTTTLGIQGDPGQTLRAWPREGRFYLGGLRTFYTPEDDIHLRILHPRSGKTLLAGPGFHFSPSYGVLPSYEDIFVILAGCHDDENVEPMYCSKDVPLVIETEGTALPQMSVLGALEYELFRPAGPMCVPEPLGAFTGPWQPEVSKR